MSLFSFAAIGINHDHIQGQVKAMLSAGCTFKAFYCPEDDLAQAFSEKFPMAVRVDDKRRILEDETIKLVLSSAIPGDRAQIGLEAMRHGKDFMSDKPGLVSLEELAEVRRVQAETKRIYTILYSEHYDQRSTIKACELVKAGAIGDVLNTVGLGPHRIRKNQRPDWFFKRARYGGILTDIGSHQAEQFLYLTGAEDAKILSATVANRSHPDKPELQDFGDMLLATDRATGYVRVDWYTPDGLSTWGDGRMFITGTEGTIELRKYVDVAGREGKDHLFLVDRKGTHYFDCTQVEKPFGKELAFDVLNRTQTHMSQAHCFKAMEIVLKAQAMAEAKLTGAA
jgi:predicted dehydrogenase